MAQSDTTAFTPKPSSIAWEGLARLDGVPLDELPLASKSIEKQRRGYVRQMLLATAIATGGILAVAAVMMVGVL